MLQESQDTLEQLHAEVPMSSQVMEELRERNNELDAQLKDMGLQSGEVERRAKVSLHKWMPKAICDC